MGDIDIGIGSILPDIGVTAGNGREDGGGLRHSRPFGPVSGELGEDGVDKRIDHLALAIQLGATVYDLEEAELCYSPPFGSAKDPINFAGMVAAGVLRGDMPIQH